MKKILLMLGVFALICTPAMAGKNAGGAMIVHTNDAVVATTGFCDTAYDDPGSCENAGTRSDLDGNQGQASIIWFLAAFDAASNPGVTVCYFGNDHNLPAGWILPWSFCGPAGTLEVPDTGWPEAPGTAGNSVAFGSPVMSHLFPFYWFSCYSHAADAYFGSGINPTGGYAGFVSDDNPGVLDETDKFGTVHWFDDEGGNTCPTPPAPTGACCYMDGTCEVTEMADCAGDYLGDDTVCDPNPCPQPGACCFDDGHCEYVLEAMCQGTYFIPDEFCDPNPCDQPEEPAACCFEDGHCEMLLMDECAAAGGDHQGEGTVCDPNDCPQPTEACCFDDGSCADLEPDVCTGQGGTPQGPGTICAETECPPIATETTTWGSIKANYR